MKSNALLLLLFASGITLTAANVINGPKETVKGGEYVYYNLSSIDSYVYLQLQTESGDCDLYVSEESKFPTYTYYTTHSATCGLDTALVRRRTKGPVYIGIYGHPSFDASECELEVCLIERPETFNEFTDEVTEISTISEEIQTACQASRSTHTSFLGRSLSAVGLFIRRIELEGILLEVIATFAQVMI